jgi:FAD:protein FMN transferase
MSVLRLERLEFTAMGTPCAVAVAAGPRETMRARHALDAARAEVDACEQALSRFIPESDLSRLNDADGEWAVVDVRLLEALELAVEAREATHGKFDPTVLPALVAAGYDRTFEELVARPARTVDGWRAGAALEIDPEAGAARLERGSALDLGGIGKGYAARRALDAMRHAWPTLPGALVDLGGDLEVAGRPPQGGPWRIAVADPRGDVTLAVLRVRAGGVATSGRDVRRFGPHRSLHHLIDPTTGAPAVPGPLTVTVVASDAAQAEAHATALAISSLEDAIEHVEANQSLSALYVPRDGEPVQLGELPVEQPRRVVFAA